MGQHGQTPPDHPLGNHRILVPGAGSGPKSAVKLDAAPQIRDSEILLAVKKLNLDSASYQQLWKKHGGDGDEIRAEVLEIIQTRGKMENPVTKSGGMLLGTVKEVGPANETAQRMEIKANEDVATLVSLTLTPLLITDQLRSWDGLSEQVPCEGTAVLFSKTILARVPTDMTEDEALAVFDVCGAPKLTAELVKETGAQTVLVLGAAGKSGSLSLAAARAAGATNLIGLVKDDSEVAVLRASGLADRIVAVDARNAEAVAAALPDGADLTVVCVNVAGCEASAILATKDSGTVLFFSMATDFADAALAHEGFVAEPRMVIGSGYRPGHADYAVDVYRRSLGVQQLFQHHLA